MSVTQKGTTRRTPDSTLTLSRAQVRHPSPRDTVMANMVRGNYELPQALAAANLRAGATATSHILRGDLTWDDFWTAPSIAEVQRFGEAANAAHHKHGVPRIFLGMAEGSPVKDGVRPIGISGLIGIIRNAKSCIISAAADFARFVSIPPQPDGARYVPEDNSFAIDPDHRGLVNSLFSDPANRGLAQGLVAMWGIAAKALGSQPGKQLIQKYQADVREYRNNPDTLKARKLDTLCTLESMVGGAIVDSQVQIEGQLGQTLAPEIVSGFVFNTVHEAPYATSYPVIEILESAQ